MSSCNYDCVRDGDEYMRDGDECMRDGDECMSYADECMRDGDECMSYMSAWGSDGYMGLVVNIWKEIAIHDLETVTSSYQSM